ncbi:MAG TPA: aconitate hydratase AcnA [Gemmatimonadaceae bacterium]|jgi:aconitate hydratase|nr:aconitate hydratase AcnA [Gemmatimonadaceae bacterium]
MTHPNSFGSRSTLDVAGRQYTIFRLDSLSQLAGGNAQHLPFSLKILLENLLRNEDGKFVKADDVRGLASWNVKGKLEREIAFRTARVLLQDFTGVPAVVDLAAMRDALARLGGDARLINPLQPVDLVIDHSVQVDEYGSEAALLINADFEFRRNQERYAFLRWGQKALHNFRVVPPDTGIVHQINLEYLAQGVFTEVVGKQTYAYPDSLVGTDSHTTMINGLGVLGWGVGGIEAEAAMLGQPVSMLIPEVVGFKMHGRLQPGSTATDLVLTVTEMLRKKKVVGKFVEFYGAGLSSLSLADRATIGNMAPEYGATMGFFPIDAETINYLRFTGRDEAQVQLVEAYCKTQGLFRTDDTPDPIFSDTLELDLKTVEPSLAGPKRPQDRVPLKLSKKMFKEALAADLDRTGTVAAVAAAKQAMQVAASPQLSPSVVATDPAEQAGEQSSIAVEMNGEKFSIRHGSVVIAAITSCTNTSNPSVMLAAGLLAKNAVAQGLSSKPWVKTSLAPGSKVVTDYFNKAGVMGPLQQLRFNVVGFGCTTCIGNSGPLPQPVADAIESNKLVVAAVLSGNRNFEGRINPLTRFNYLASPPLVVAYALAGRMDIDFNTEPLGVGKNGPVFLRDIWPSPKEVEDEILRSVKAEMFKTQYSNVFHGDDNWRGLPVPEGDLYAWDPDSTYVKNPPFFDGMTLTPPGIRVISGARALGMFGDSITTDHISPAGSIPASSPAGKWLIEHGVKTADFNSYGARRGNHEVMMRGTFANIRLRNELAAGTEGGWTTRNPGDKPVSIYDASMEYQREGIPLVIVAGKEYGTGSSRDWAAKGTLLLGVRAVIAESFERIHRSNLVGMGVLPLEFMPGQTRTAVGLTGFEVFSIDGMSDDMKPRAVLSVRARSSDGSEKTFQAVSRIDTPEEMSYYRHGGILPYVLRQLVGRER